MAAVSEDPITLWLKLGALEKLEQVVLDGYGDQLYGKTSRIPQVNKFLRQVPVFQSKIDEIHKAVSTGDLREVQRLVDRKKLAFCRDQLGASPMHKAVLFGQRPVIDYLLDRYPSVVHARDHRGRTPLHYAAVIGDGGEIYKMLLDHGTDLKATDVFGNRPEYYMHAQDEMDVRALREGTEPAKQVVRIRHFRPTDGSEKEMIARSAKPVGTRTRIREMIQGGDLEGLEELVLQGHGDRLLGESAANPLVRDFVQMVPIYMERIYEIHRAVTRGRLRDVQTLLDRKKLALARDPLGATPLHKAVMYGHRDVAEYIADNFPLSKDTKDLDGRTPLHYAAALKDNHDMYNMLVTLSANPLVLDYRGKTAEYYLQFPEHLHLEQMIRQSQRTNANYMANHANRMKAVTSPKRKSPYPARALDFNGNIRPMPNGEVNGTTEETDNTKNGPVSFKLPKKTLFRSQPLLPPPKLRRLEVNSANIRRWVREEDLEKLEGAVLEGYGDKVAAQRSDSDTLQKYISDQVPQLVRRIEAIHIAVSNDDLTELQNQLSDKDHMVLAKDHFGMAPVHRAVLMNRPDALAFLVERFPETLNARDKEGRTALHYAAAMSREPGTSNYFKLLLEAGADPRIRDNQGRSPEYYRTHHVPIPHKLNQHQRASKKQRSRSEPPQHRPKKLLPGISNPGSLPQVTMDKINGWLQNGDVDGLRDFVQEGFGQHLLGKTSWNEEVRQYLKTVPGYLMCLGSLFHSAETGDLSAVQSQVRADENLLKARNAEGWTVLHHAVLHDQPDIVHHLLDRHPTLLNIKDRTGRTPLIVAGQQKNNYMFTLLATAGADPMSLDQKGRSADFYMTSLAKPIPKTTTQISPQTTPPGAEESSAPEPTPPQDTPEQDKPQSEEDSAPPSEEKREEEEMEVTPETDPEATEDHQCPDESAPKTDDSSEAVESCEPPATEPTPEEEEKTQEHDEEVEPKETIPKEEERPDEEEIPPTVEQPVAPATSGDRLNELIDVWIKDRDLLRLEHVVIAGQGERLIGRQSDDRQVQEFLDLVPTYMARIRGVHEAVVRGHLGEVESVLTRKRFALSRDHLGASPLHLAVLHAHPDTVKYIIDNFPEALDGPDNEGRTPLHYAAVMRDGGAHYRILLMAGADETAKDKAGHTPDYYLTHPGVLNIRDLLEGYRIREAQQRRPSQVNIWQRPPTDEAEKLDLFEDDEDEFDPFEDLGPTPDFSDPIGGGVPELVPPPPAKPRASIYPILFDRQNRDSRYLARVLGDALIRGLTQVAERRPRDPVGFLATYLYQCAARTAPREEVTTEVKSIVDAEGAEEEDEEEEAQREETSRTPLEAVKEEEDADDFEEEDFSLEFEDHIKMKDESGQTVLHFAAARPHPDGSFRALLVQAESLIGERDALYRTCRDVGEESGQEENVLELDRFVVDAYVQGRAQLVRSLLQDGYEPLVHLRDDSGRDLRALLQQRGLQQAGALLRDVVDFTKRRVELHGHIRKGYLEGVARLVKSDGALVTAKGPRARCALHIGVLFGHGGIVSTMVRANPSAVHCADNLGRTPLHYAMATQNVDKIAKILITAGALKTTKDVRLRTPGFYFVYPEEIQNLREEELRLA